MHSEVATMQYLAAKTSIPVPEVFHHDFSLDSEIGAPYMLISYIHGSVASELSQQRDCHPDVVGTPAQHKRFRAQMAKIQVELVSHRSDGIGNLYRDGDAFIIGPELETGKGPWETAAEYFADLIAHVSKVVEYGATDELRRSISFSPPRPFTQLMKKHGFELHSEGPFCLTTRDFGPHNLLVDEDFNIVGVIDLDGVMAAPFDVVTQFPDLMGLDRPIPGDAETRPSAIERLMEVEPLLEEYQEVLASVCLDDSRDFGEQDLGRRIADHMMSDGAAIVLGVKAYQPHQDFVNDAWFSAYERLMAEPRASVGGGRVRQGWLQPIMAWLKG
jgi:hypothetical protein